MTTSEGRVRRKFLEEEELGKYGSGAIIILDDNMDSHEGGSRNRKSAAERGILHFPLELLHHVSVGCRQGSIHI